MQTDSQGLQAKGVHILTILTSMYKQVLVYQYQYTSTGT